jgi:DNA-binding NtrC family response regulator
MRILVVDDEAKMGRILERTLSETGSHEVRAFQSPVEALEDFREAPYDLVLTDLRMPGMDGLKLMSELKRLAPATSVVLMTAYAEVPTAVDAMKRGAVDYLMKPFEEEALLKLVNRIAQERALDIKAEHAGEGEVVRLGSLIAASLRMRELFRKVRQAAPTDTVVLIEGESGTGKEGIARAIHAMSKRSEKPFIEVDCASIPENLMESELFGHEKGAFTGASSRKPGRIELAEGGTLFLDEVGELPFTLQAKFLRFLQERNYFRVGGNERIFSDVRVVAATNQDLGAAVSAKRFRTDLFHRLHVFALKVPPLRERKEDIPLLVRHCVERKGGKPEQITPEYVEAMRDHTWPGNVRELENSVERALILAQGETLRPEHGVGEGVGVLETASKEESGTLALGEQERKLILDALRQTGGNKTEAAKALGISRRRLYSRMERLGIES